MIDGKEAINDTKALIFLQYQEETTLNISGNCHNRNMLFAQTTRTMPVSMVVMGALGV